MAPSELVESSRSAEKFLGLKHLGPQNLIQQQDEEARKAFEAFTAQHPTPSLRCVKAVLLDLEPVHSPFSAPQNHFSWGTLKLYLKMQRKCFIMIALSKLFLHRTSGPQGRIEPLTLIDDPSAWTAASVKRADNWIYTLNASDISEIDNALKLVASLHVRKQVKSYSAGI